MVGEIIIETVAAVPSPIVVLFSPHTMHVVEPGLDAQLTDLPCDSGVAVTDEKSEAG